MLTQSANRQFVHILQTLLDIVRIQCGQRTHHLDILLTHRKNVSKGTKNHAEVSEERSDAAQRLVIIRLNSQHILLFIQDDAWSREEGLQTFPYAHRTASRTSATMRCGECLVQIDMHHVESHVTRSTSPQHRIQVRPVVIHQSAAVVYPLGNLRNILLEQSQRIRVCHHHPRNLRSVLFNQCDEVRQIHQSLIRTLHF